MKRGYPRMPRRRTTPRPDIRARQQSRDAFFSALSTPPRTAWALFGAFGCVGLQLPAVGDHDLGTRLAASGAEAFNFLDDVHALDDLAKDDVTAIEPWRFHGAQEELRAVGARASVGHAEHARLGMFQFEILVFKFVAVDRFAARPEMLRIGRKVPPLAHKPGNDAMKRASFVAETLLARAQGAKVLRRFGDDVAPQFDHDAAQLLAVRRDVHVAAGMRSRVGIRSRCAPGNKSQTANRNQRQQ